MLATSLGETVHVSYIIATVCGSYGGETVHVSYIIATVCVSYRGETVYVRCISDVAAMCCAY